MKKPTVLLIAEAANPEWVSVPLVGWSLANALRDVAEVHLATQVRNRDAVLRAGLIENQDFTAIDTEAIAAPMHKLASILRMGSGKGWTMTTAVSGLVYPFFERKVWEIFGNDIKSGRFDIVHRITPLTPTAVSPIAHKCAKAGVPFVVGPLNGGVPWPKGFDAERRREREWLSYVRSVYKLKPGRKRMYQATSAVLAGSLHTASEVPRSAQDRTVYLPENAINPDRFNKRSVQSTNGPLRACFIGRLVPYKGADMLLEAAAPLLSSGRLVLDLIGDGPMRADLEAQARSLGLSHEVTFHGQVDHGAVQDIAAQANLLTFPSIREFGGGVVLEAMALGLVPVIVDYAGPGELVTGKTGYKIPIGPREEIVTGLRARLESIADDPTVLGDKAQRAYDRAHNHFTWTAKAEQVSKVYDWVLGNTSKKPILIPSDD